MGYQSIFYILTVTIVCMLCMFESRPGLSPTSTAQPAYRIYSRSSQKFVAVFRSGRIHAHAAKQSKLDNAIVC